MSEALRFAKPEPRARGRRRAAREEADVKARVRARCVARDGSCRLRGVPGHICEGASQWSHLTSRAKTRGMAPERRHRTETSLMLCQGAHDCLDGRAQPRLRGEFLEPAKGADGRMAWYFSDALFHEEPA